MEQQPQSRITLQTMALGQRVFTISGPASWGENDRAQSWAVIAGEIITGVAERLVGCHILRLVVATSDVGSEVLKWQKELGRPEVITNDATAVTAGKTLVWGDGSPENTYAVIVLADSFAAEITTKENAPCLGKALFTHELAHVHDDMMRLHRFGAEPMPKFDDWAGIRRAIALSVWGEFFAERIGASYLPEDNVEGALHLGNDILQSVVAKLATAKSSYTQDRNIVPVWAISQEGLSRTFDQFGRVLGAVAAWREGVIKSDLVNATILLPEWSNVFLQLNTVLQRIRRYQDLETEIPNLEEIVEAAFNLVGLFPIQYSEGLQVAVR